MFQRGTTGYVTTTQKERHTLLNPQNEPSIYLTFLPDARMLTFKQICPVIRKRETTKIHHLSAWSGSVSRTDYCISWIFKQKAMNTMIFKTFLDTQILLERCQMAEWHEKHLHKLIRYELKCSLFIPIYFYICSVNMFFSDDFEWFTVDLEVLPTWYGIWITAKLSIILHFKALFIGRKVWVFSSGHRTQAQCMLIEFYLEVRVYGRQYPAAPWSGSTLNRPLSEGTKHTNRSKRHWIVNKHKSSGIYYE